jgi:hypothetical protein
MHSGHVCNPSTQEAKAEGMQDRGQPGYMARPCLKKKKKKIVHMNKIKIKIKKKAKET